MKYLARCLPDRLDIKADTPHVPLCREHQLFEKALGKVIFDCDDDHFCHIESESDLAYVGMTLSLGAFVDGHTYIPREVSVTNQPVYPECKIIKECDN